MFCRAHRLNFSGSDMKRAFIISLIAPLLLANCTVLEDRDNCSSHLTIDFSNVDRGIKEWQLWLFDTHGNLLFKDTVYRSSYNSPYIVEVPRRSAVRCLTWGNIRGATKLSEVYSLGSFITKERDVSADSLYFCTDTINTKMEDSYLEIIPMKEFATIDIYMKGWADLDYDAQLHLECANSGFYIDKRFCGSNSSTLVPVHDIGNYFTHFRCRMLRQRDTENLILSVILRRKNIDGSIGECIMERDIPIGRYLEENGYNMQGENLEDISIEIDYSYHQCLIVAEDWSATYNLLQEI